MHIIEMPRSRRSANFVALRSELPNVIVQSGNARLVFCTSRGVATFTTRFSCICLDTPDWESEGRGCAQYSEPDVHQYCKHDTGHTADGATISAKLACPVSCGRCAACSGTDCDRSTSEGHRRSMQRGEDAMATGDMVAHGTLASGTHQGPSAVVVGHAMQSEVVVHAPTLAAAQSVLCRAVARSTISSCCLVSADCVRGVPLQCHLLCAAAVVPAPPADCQAFEWFRAWHDPLAVLCANVSMTVASPQLAVNICRSANPIRACGQTIAFSTGSSRASCSEVIAAPADHFIRLTVLQSGMQMQSGESLHVFDGLLEQQELAVFNGAYVHLGAPDDGPTISCSADLADVASTMDSVCCEPPAVCDEGVPNECSAACVQVWMPFYGQCADFVSSHLPQLVPFAEQCAGVHTPFDSTGRNVRVVFEPSPEVAESSSTFATSVECIER